MMSGTLFVVATPIGNLEDITLRALRVMREVSLIAAEDTRRTAKLLNHYGISTRATSFHEHNEVRKAPALLARLAGGDDIALVTDAGTPGVSDPGERLVNAAISQGIAVRVVPGPSAVLAAIVASGLPTESFTFLGFPPQRSNARIKWLRDLAAERRTMVLFEAPHRIRQTLTDMQQVWGDRVVAIGRELTKIHEELVKGPISAVLDLIGQPRGEYTIVSAGAIEGGTPSSGLPEPSVVLTEYGLLTNIAALSRRTAIATLAQKYRVPARDVFAALEIAKL